MEDGPLKPSPIPVLTACEKLGLPPSSCIMIGDTRDDVTAAVSAGCRGYGVYTPDEYAKLMLKIINHSQSMRDSLLAAKASGILTPGMKELLDLVPSTPIPMETVSYIIQFTNECMNNECTFYRDLLLRDWGSLIEKPKRPV